MVRLAVRKASPSKARYAVKGTVKTKPKAKKTAHPKSAQHKTAQRKSAKGATHHTAHAQWCHPKIKALLDHIDSYVIVRTKASGSSDTVAKKLKNIHSSICNELRKANVINPNFAKSLKNISPSLRGISNAPKTINANAQQLAQVIKSNVRKDVVKFINTMKQSHSSLDTDLKHLESKLKKYVKTAQEKKLQLKTDPNLKRRFLTLNNAFSTFKSKWVKHLNSINLHGNKEVKLAVSQLKKQMEELQKSIKRNLAIMNRYAKSVKPKKGFKTQQIVTAGEIKALENKFKKNHEEINKFKTHAERYFDQLKAAKML